MLCTVGQFDIFTHHVPVVVDDIHDGHVMFIDNGFNSN